MRVWNSIAFVPHGWVRGHGAMWFECQQFRERPPLAAYGIPCLHRRSPQNPSPRRRPAIALPNKTTHSAPRIKTTKSVRNGSQFCLPHPPSPVLQCCAPPPPTHTHARTHTSPALVRSCLRAHVCRHVCARVREHDCAPARVRGACACVSARVCACARARSFSSRLPVTGALAAPPAAGPVAGAALPAVPSGRPPPRAAAGRGCTGSSVRAGTGP